MRDGAEVERLGPGEGGLVVLNQTPFYGESGGQVGDTGKVSNPGGFRGDVTDTSKKLGKLHILSVGRTVGSIAVGDTLHQEVDEDRRRATRANHSATHLLHAALRTV